jgi:hypothetical protein
MLVLAFIERAAWIEVVDASEEAIVLAFPFSFNLTLVAVMAGNVGDEIHGPAD